MRGVYATLALALVSSIHAAPLQKRIQQVIADSLTQWEQACINAGGGIRCNPLKVSAFSTLLIAPGPCEQQNAADQMIDLARELNNDAEMIRLAQIFRQQPRNSVCISPFPNLGYLNLFFSLLQSRSSIASKHLEIKNSRGYSIANSKESTTMSSRAVSPSDNLARFPSGSQACLRLVPALPTRRVKFPMACSW